MPGRGSHYSGAAWAGGSVVSRGVFKKGASMNRKLAWAVLSVGAAVAGAATVTAADKTIEAKAPMAWEPKADSGSVGEGGEWKMGAGSCGRTGHGGGGSQLEAGES